jgi:hypothetical protein
VICIVFKVVLRINGVLQCIETLQYAIVGNNIHSYFKYVYVLQTILHNSSLLTKPVATYLLLDINDTANSGISFYVEMFNGK